MSALDVDLETLPARLLGSGEVSWTERHLLADLVKRHGVTPRQRDRLRHLEITRHLVLGEVFGAEVEIAKFREEALASDDPVDLRLPACRGRTAELVGEAMDRFSLGDPSSVHRIVREHRRSVEASLFVAVDELAPADLCSGRAGSNSLVADLIGIRPVIEGQHM
jgi:hypothetical protein